METIPTVGATICFFLFIWNGFDKNLQATLGWLTATIWAISAGTGG